LKKGKTQTYKIIRGLLEKGYILQFGDGKNTRYYQKL
jgi:hypothetical protein